MKARQAGLAHRYEVALRKHLEQGPVSSLRPALRLGHQAVALGLETLDLARIHEAALVVLVLPSYASATRAGMIKRAGCFFSEANTPIERTHHAALKASAHFQRINKTLARRISDLADSKKSLRQGIVQREGAEEALRKSEAHHTKLLEESRRLQKHLQHLTRQLLLAQEDKRKKTSRDLHDEIGQTLLGINVRLLALKTAAGADTEGLNKEIASTQRLVTESMKLISRFAHEFRRHQKP